MAYTNPFCLSRSPQTGPIPGISVTSFPPMGESTKLTCFQVGTFATFLKEKK